MSLCFSCNKEDDSKINFTFKANEIIYYPDYILLTFLIQPEGNNSPYKLEWVYPDSLKEEGPYTIKITSDIILNFKVIDSKKNISKGFIYKINTDTIDSIKYDWRNRYIGTYCCNVIKNGTDHYLDTLIVYKNVEFTKFNVQTKSDRLRNFAGAYFSYIGNGNFYAYHSGFSVSNDSIYYVIQGSSWLFKYEGKKILP